MRVDRHHLNSQLKEGASFKLDYTMSCKQDLNFLNISPPQASAHPQLVLPLPCPFHTVQELEH